MFPSSDGKKRGDLLCWALRKQSNPITGLVIRIVAFQRAHHIKFYIFPFHMKTEPDPVSETLRDFWPRIMGNVQNISHIYYIIFINLQT
jgi:hypothetical protein